MIEFQFSNVATISKESLTKKLELKMKESSSNAVKFLFIGKSTTIEQWEFVYNLKTRQLEDLKFIKEFSKQNYKIYDFILDKTNNRLIVSYISEGIHAWNLSDNTNFQLLNNSSSRCLTWYETGSKKYLVFVTPWNAIELLDCETKQIVLSSDKQKDGQIEKLIVNDKTHKLMSWNEHGLIKIWCLKTLKPLSVLEKRSIQKGTLCFLDHEKTLFAATNRDYETAIWKNEKNIGFEGERFICLTQFIYSFNLKLLVHFDSWLTVLHFSEKEMEISPLFTVGIEFKGHYLMATDFLDPVTQTKVLVFDNVGNVTLVDLILKKITWQKIYAGGGKVGKIQVQ